MSVLGGGGSQSAWREPQASRRLLTTFSGMDNNLGQNFNELRWLQGEVELAQMSNPGEKSFLYRNSSLQPELSLYYQASTLPTVLTGPLNGIKGTVKIIIIHHPPAHRDDHHHPSLSCPQ